MRGVVSLAAALAIPIALDNGSEFPQRNLILFITFVVILLTLVVQGLTLPFFIKRSRVFDNLPFDRPTETVRREVKTGLRKHSYEFLKNRHSTESAGHEGMEAVLKLWEAKANGPADDGMSEKAKGAFLQLLESQRVYLTELNKDPDVDEEIIRAELYQIDLEEERIRRI